MTHNLNEAFMMSDRIAVMGNGRIEQIGKGQTFLVDHVEVCGGVSWIKRVHGKALRNRVGLLEVSINRVLILAFAASDLAEGRVLVTLRPENALLSPQSVNAAWKRATIIR